MIKAILFDFNGVIIDDEPIQMKAYQEGFAAEGVELTEEGYYACMGMDDRTFIRTIFERAGHSPDEEKIAKLSQDKTARWRQIVAENIPIFEGMHGFIKKMANDFALGVVSMAKREEIEFVLEQSGLRDCFAVVISADEVTRCKPDPESYRKGFAAIDSYRVKQGSAPMVHTDCLVIEDSPQGVMAGKAAGLKTLGVTNTVSAEELRAAGADAVAKNLSDWMPDTARRVFV